MQDLWTYLKNADKPIVLYGTGNGADKTVARLNKDGVKISGVFSSDGFKKNKLYAGHTVTDYTTLKNRFGEIIILVCFGSHLPQLMERVKNLSKENEVYFPDVPVAGEEIFDLSFAKKHKDKLFAAYSLLEDDQSKSVFENIVRFRLSGRLDYLLNCESSREEVFKLLSLKENENFLDLGAFVGDTVEEFLRFSGGYNKIVAVEPDKRNFRKLLENTAGLNNLECVNAAVSDRCGEMHISANHGRGNGSEGKKISVNTLTVDSLLEKTNPTFIKMDVEGNELLAIDGACKTIKALVPKMHIACYHTPYDIFEIPLRVKSICPEYKVYMRHHSCFPAWDINCIFK